MLFTAVRNNRKVIKCKNSIIRSTFNQLVKACIKNFIDMVINISRLKCNDDLYVENEIKELKQACGKLVLKVIIETCLLTDEEKIRACKLAVNAGADFVKTSTGFSTGGATIHDVKLMHDTVNNKCLVKASGGIRDKETFLAMIEAGANRIGASAGVKIMEDLKK